MKTFGRKIFLVCGMIAAVLLASLIVFDGWISAKAWDANPAARPAIVAVLKAQAWSKLSGGYWDNEMYNQQTYVAGLPLQARLDYYRVLVLECDLDTSRGLVFINSVGNDADALHQNLLTFKSSAKYRQLSPAQQKAIRAWTDEMDIVAKARKTDPAIAPE
jgi:hypothetical protein